MKAEAEAVWQKYAAGIVALLMAKAEVLKFEILPLKPYTGLESLFAKP